MVVCYITGHELKPEQKLEMIRYLKSNETPDGGWGLLVPSPSLLPLLQLVPTSLLLLLVPPPSLLPTLPSPYHYYCYTSTSVTIPSQTMFNYLIFSSIHHHNLLSISLCILSQTYPTVSYHSPLHSLSSLSIYTYIPPLSVLPITLIPSPPPLHPPLAPP